MANVLTASKEKVDWAISILDKAGNGEGVEYRDFFGATAVLSAVSYAAFDLTEEVAQLRARVQELKDECDQREAQRLDACNQRNFAYIERDELAEALKPFAKVADTWDELHGVEGLSFSASDIVPLTVEPYQAAREALRKMA